jgi:hypothetical protein
MEHSNPKLCQQLVALAFISLGVLVLVGGILGVGFDLVWPFLIIAGGSVFLYFAFTGKPDLAGLSIPGALISGTGAILFLQSLTDHWESWAYAWTLYGLLLGWAFIYTGGRTGDRELAETGRYFMIFGLLGFVVLGVFFELFIFNTFGWLGKIVLPLLLIAFGVWLLSRDRSGVVLLEKPKKRKNSPENGFETAAQHFDEAVENIRRRVKVPVTTDGELPPGANGLQTDDAPHKP